jgi:hypothetical protein
VSLQFKRPEYRYGKNAAMYKHWLGPYYRFKRDQSQHKVLKRLETRLAKSAVVRYAAPAFHTVAQLETAQITQHVIEESGHVAPSAFGAHQVWTYQKPGVHGLPNPDGDPVEFDTIRTVFARAAALPDRDAFGAVGELDLSRDQALRRHLGVVAEACRYRDPDLRALIDQWSPQLADVDGLSQSTALALVEYVTVQTLAARHRIGWWVTG